MSQYILLFRGINVSGNDLLPIKTLVPLRENAGYNNIKRPYRANSPFRSGEKYRTAYCRRIWHQPADTGIKQG